MDTEELNEKVDRVMALVGTDLTHRIVTEWINKSSEAVKKRFGDALLDLIPRVAHDVAYAKIKEFASVVADEVLKGLRPQIESLVRKELEKQSDVIAASIVEAVRKRAPLVAEQQVSDLIKRGARAT